MALIRIDGTRTQTLRTILLAALAAVAVILLGALGLRRLALHGIHLDLPGRLGANISQTANGFTYSQSQGGHTIFTIHASKLVQFKGDEAELHGVMVTLYGPPGSQRRDRIQGSDFLYNRNTGVVTAKGTVEIDLASPSAAATPGQPALPDTIHVETSGLVFNQKTADAETTQPLAFTLPRASGKAVGGSYNSRTGVLILQSAVELHTDQNGVSSVVYASHAQLLRDQHIAYLLSARDEYEGNRSSADEAILRFRPNGTVEHLDAQDHVHVITADGSELYSATATADFNAQSQPLLVTAGGGVNFVSTSADSNMHGNAVSGTMVFAAGPDGKPMLHHAQFTNAVSFVLQQNSLGGDPRGSAIREMTASTLDVSFATGKDGKAVAQTAIARGGAKVNLHDLPYGAPPHHTLLEGQQLQAQLADGHQLRQVDGGGGTTVVNYMQDGATETSTGDTLHATFLPIARARELPPSARVSADMAGSAQLQSATQQGHVTMIAAPAPNAKASDGSPEQPLYGSGNTAAYDGKTEILHLMGDTQAPTRVHNDTLAVTAANVDYSRGTGDATATGDVRATLLQKQGGKTPPPGLGSSGPVHVVAARAEMMRADNSAVFFGSKAAPSRMWQGENSVAAPILQVSKNGGVLQAHDAQGSSAADSVHAVFASKMGARAGAPTRVAADTLFYADSTRTGDFHGAVIAQQPGGTVHADDAQVFLAEAPPAKPVPAKANATKGETAKTGAAKQAAAEPAQPSGVERLVATGHVVLTQPGRRASGEKLVYTGADGNYLLTGTPAAPPRLVDAQKGQTTGAALLFRSSDNSVEVLSSDAEGVSRRTETDTRTPK